MSTEKKKSKITCIFLGSRQNSSLNSSKTRTPLSLKRTLNCPSHKDKESVWRWRAIYIWWTCYLIFGDFNNFTNDYYEAWGRRGTQKVYLFTKGAAAPVLVKLPECVDDYEMASVIQMYYRIMKVKRGLASVLLPKRLHQIDVFEVCLSTFIAPSFLFQLHTKY